jgi:hypothetical protein
MSDTIRVFVNEQPVNVPRGASAEAAVRAVDPPLADAVAHGAAQLTDARGLAVAHAARGRRAPAGAAQRPARGPCRRVS